MNKKKCSSLRWLYVTIVMCRVLYNTVMCRVVYKVNKVVKKVYKV